MSRRTIRGVYIEQEDDESGGTKSKKNGKKTRVLTEISTPGTNISFNDMYNRDKEPITL